MISSTSAQTTRLETSMGAPPVVRSKAETVFRTVIWETMRVEMPLETLFNPKLKINLETLISDQELFLQAAEALKDLPPESTGSAEEIRTHFVEHHPSLVEKLDRLQEGLPHFYEACADVVCSTPQEYQITMRDALGGRIYTLRNALVAIKTPELIAKSQKTNGLTPHSTEAIQAEGALFIRRCLSMYFRIGSSQKGPFGEELTRVAGQLIPFVRQITASYLNEYGKGIPEGDPLSWRNRSGENHHGLIAATVMNAALQVCGYDSRFMCRCDLEPKATLATAHGIVEVTGPEGKRYMVDPAYLQFYKDICTSDQALPDAAVTPVLVLRADEIACYVNEHIMPRWKTNFERVQRDPMFLRQLIANDQEMVYTLHQNPPRGIDLGIVRMEDWVRSAMTRPWDLSSFRVVQANEGFQEIFRGAGQKRTYQLIVPMGMGSFLKQGSTQDVERALRAENPGERNSAGVLSLIAQLPRRNRDSYGSLLDIDPRVQDLDPCINAYFRAIARLVNPEGHPIRALYACSGADATSILLSTNATELLFVDSTNVTLRDFEQALARVLGGDILSMRGELERSSGFLRFRTRYSGAMSVSEGGKNYMENLPSKLLLDLQAMGVDMRSVKLKGTKETLEIEFDWFYHGSSGPTKRRLVFISADITQPSLYPRALTSALQTGIDCFFMKGAFFVPRKYPQFLPNIIEHLRAGGWMLTSDKTVFMETVNPEDCLEAHGLICESTSSEEIERLKELTSPPLEPMAGFPLLKHERIARMPGTDESYWTTLTIRRKKA